MLDELLFYFTHCCCRRRLRRLRLTYAFSVFACSSLSLSLLLSLSLSSSPWDARRYVTLLRSTSVVLCPLVLWYLNRFFYFPIIVFIVVLFVYCLPLLLSLSPLLPGTSSSLFAALARLVFFFCLLRLLTLPLLCVPVALDFLCYLVSRVRAGYVTKGFRNKCAVLGEEFHLFDWWNPRRSDGIDDWRPQFCKSIGSVGAAFQKILGSRRSVRKVIVSKKEGRFVVFVGRKDVGLEGGAGSQALVERIKKLVPVLEIAFFCYIDGYVVVCPHRLGQLFEGVNVLPPPKKGNSMF